MNLWDAYNALLISDDVERIRKLTIRYDLYRMVEDLPGDIIEAGVFKGAGFMYWLKLLAIYEPSSISRVIGFDCFSNPFSDLQGIEKKAAECFVLEAGKDISEVPEQLKDISSRMMMSDRAILVDGDVMDTARVFVSDKPGFRCKLLHLDMDSYQATRSMIEAVYPKMVNGGIVVMDEYSLERWGESDAVDEYVSTLFPVPQIKRIRNARTPTAYFIVRKSCD